MRVDDPLPHDLLHEDQAVQEDHCPSVGTGEKQVKWVYVPGFFKDNFFTDRYERQTVRQTSSQTDRQTDIVFRHVLITENNVTLYT